MGGDHQWSPPTSFTAYPVLRLAAAEHVAKVTGRKRFAPLNSRWNFGQTNGLYIVETTR
jgi:hypothetical protein